MRTEPSFSSEANTNPFEGVQDSPYLDDYRQRYGLSCDPFADDPHFPFYTGAERRLILEKLVHLCQFANNLLVVLGDYSTGKTRMAQALIDALEDEDDICFLEGQITTRFTDMLDEIIEQFELEGSDDLTDFFEKTPESEGVAVVIVDNAHHLADDVLKELILLMRPNTESRLRLVFLGEPLLLNRLEQMDVSHVVMTDFLLERFDLPEAVDYLNFRMEMSDYLGPEIFDEAIVESWWRSANGQIDRLHACAQQKLLESVSSSSGSSGGRNSFPLTHILAVTVLASILIMGFFYLGRDTDKPKNSIASSVNSSLAVLPNATPAIKSSLVSQQSVSSLNALSSSQEVPLVVATTESNEENASTTSLPQSDEKNIHQSSSVKTVALTSDQSTKAIAETSVAKYSSSFSVKHKATKSVVAKTVSDDDVQNSPVDTKVVAQGDFTEQEKTILSWDDSEHTLQIVGVSTEKSAKEFIASQSNKKELLLFRSTRQGKDWFVVVYGHFATTADARKAVLDLPESQQKATPWSRSVRAIKKEIRSR